MASGGSMMGILLVLGLVAMSWSRAAAQSGCTTAITSLAPCLNYVSGNSSTPSSSCCSQLASVVQSTPQCLCSLLSGGSPIPGITINQTQALQLPGACNVKTPPVSQCNAASGPTTTPAAPVAPPVGAPAESSNNTPEAADTPASSTTPAGTGTPGGSKAVPSPPGTTSGVGSIKVSLTFMVSLLYVASYAFTA